MATYTIMYELVDSIIERETGFEAPTDHVAKKMFIKWAAQFEGLFEWTPILINEAGEEIADLDTVEV